jgi:antitoxin (DNA-binding transcriptional repressor) of toxin-antitoxin stability system
MIVTVRTLRRRMAACAMAAARGENVVVFRRDRPWALLRPLLPGERCRTQSITSFRDDLRRGLLRARRRPLRLTWRDEPLAVVVCALPRDYVLTDDLS